LFATRYSLLCVSLAEEPGPCCVDLSLNHLLRDISVERRARLRWDAANAVQISVHAVDLMFESSGGRAIFLDNPIQRYFRDVHAIRAHALNNPQRAGRTFAMAEMGSFITERGFPADIFV